MIQTCVTRVCRILQSCRWYEAFSLFLCVAKEVGGLEPFHRPVFRSRCGLRERAIDNLWWPRVHLVKLGFPEQRRQSIRR